MHKIIYFGNKPLVLSNPITKPETVFHPIDKLLVQTEFTSQKIKETIHALLHDDIDGCIFEYTHTDDLLEAFKAEMVVLPAGGGLVYTPQHTVLLIFRRGKWDLPKGKLDEGETMEECALREVQEETGLQNVGIQKPLTITWHTYQQDGQLILKESHWYLMQTPSEENLTPQLDEDIEVCKWVSIHELDNYLQNTHPSILDVFKAGRDVLQKENKTF